MATISSTSTHIHSNANANANASMKYADVSNDFIKYIFNLNNDGLELNNKFLNICVVLEMFSYSLKYKCDEIHKSNEKKFNYEKRIKHIFNKKIGDKKISRKKIIRLINNLIQKIIFDSLSYVGFNLVIENIPTMRIDTVEGDEDDIKIDNEVIYASLEALKAGRIISVLQLYHDTYAISYENSADAKKCFNMINTMEMAGNIIVASHNQSYQNSLTRDYYIYNEFYTENHMNVYDKYYSQQTDVIHSNTYRTVEDVSPISNTSDSNRSNRSNSSKNDKGNDSLRIIEFLLSIYNFILITIYYDKVKQSITNGYVAVVTYATYATNATSKFTTLQLSTMSYIAFIMSCIAFTPILS